MDLKIGWFPSKKKMEFYHSEKTLTPFEFQQDSVSYGIQNRAWGHVELDKLPTTLVTRAV